MDFRQAERRFQELQALLSQGSLTEPEFRLEVAKLFLQDDQGVFWMIDAMDGAWYRNSGEGWTAGNPHSESGVSAVPPPPPRRTRWVLAVAIPLLLVLALAASSWFWQWPVALSDMLGLTTGSSLEIVIASPSDGGEVFVGQEVAVEATLLPGPELPATDRVELRVNGTVVGTQPLNSRAEPGQTALPVSLIWLPSEMGEFQVDVIALTAQGDVQGQASIRLTVNRASSEAP